jgi:hypothetical protein
MQFAAEQTLTSALQKSRREGSFGRIPDHVVYLNTRKINKQTSGLFGK